MSFLTMLASAPLTFDEPVGDLPVVSDARWSEALTGNSWGGFLVWIILLVALQFALWPLVRRMFSALPDRGWGFSRLISLLLSGYLVWLGASTQVLAFRAIWCWVALVLLAAVSWLVVDRRWRHSEVLGPDVRSMAMSSEGVFWAVFLLFVVIRALNPDSYHPIWGGEKPLEFAQMNGILRSAHMPPVDPWYAGGFINYYYYGFYLVAFMCKLTGIPLEIAFNLAEPTFPALLAAGTFGLTAGLGRRLMKSTAGSIAAGLIGVFFVNIAGNLVVAHRLIEKMRHGIGAPGDASYWMFMPARAIPSMGQDYRGITEFPYFGALYGDLHPHMFAMPMTVLATALAWQLAASWRHVPALLSRRGAMRELPEVLAPIALAGFTIGTIWMTNAWDMPMFTAVIVVGLVMFSRGADTLTKRVLTIIGFVAGVAAIGYLVALPFNMNYVALFSSVDKVRDPSPLASIEAHVGAQLLLMTLGIGALVMQRTDRLPQARPLFTLIAPLVGALALVVQWRAHSTTATWEPTADVLVMFVFSLIWAFIAWFSVRHTNEFGIPGKLLDLVPPVAVVVALFAAATHRPTLGLFLGLGISAGVLWLALEKSAERFVAALIAGATLLGATMEVIYLKDNLWETEAYRMNSIFKFYNQIWDLMGIAVGVLIGYAVWSAFSEHAERDDTRERSAGPWRWLAVSSGVVMAFTTAMYPVVATPIRIDQVFEHEDRGPSLNAYAWMDTGTIPMHSNDPNAQAIPYADDRAAITWLNRNVHGSPVIAEAVYGTYRCNGSRIAINTGLPAPVGWAYHESQQRDAVDLYNREQQMRTLYTVPDPTVQQAILDEYGVEYVVVGFTERHYPRVSGNDCIDAGNALAIESLTTLPTLKLVYEHGSTKVYEVVRQ